jgi:hypothetical protein
MNENWFFSKHDAGCVNMHALIVINHTIFKAGAAEADR